MAQSPDWRDRLARLAILSLAATGLAVCAARLAGPSVPWLGPLFQGTELPLALFRIGIVWFAVVISLELGPTLGTGLNSENARVLEFVLSLVASALLFRAAYGAMQQGVVPSRALLTLLLCTFGVFVVTAATDMTPFRRLPAALRAEAWMVASTRQGHRFLGPPAILTVLIIIALAHGRVQERKAKLQARDAFEQWLASQSRVESSILQAKNALVVVRFVDYQCPPCRLTFMAYGPVIDRFRTLYPGRVKSVTIDFPLDSTCNAGATSAMHPLACEAAAAVRMARCVGREDELEKWLFSNQRDLSHARLWEAAFRLSGVEYSEGVYRSAIAEIQQDLKAAAALRVRTTPTYFINGIRMEGFHPTEHFEIVLEHEAKSLNDATRSSPRPQS